MTIFTKRQNLYDKTTCNICNSSTFNLHRRECRTGDKVSWECESTMALLDLDTVESSIRFCPRCFHAFRYPLFDESLIYGDAGTQTRKETYERYFPGKTYENHSRVSDDQWCHFLKNAFNSFSGLLSHLSTNKYKLSSMNTVKILDWGGGDGLLGEALSLISKKALNVQCHSYCFDYQQWDKKSQSPYFEYLDYNDVFRKGPYDIIAFSHVLEHAALPKNMIDNVMNCLDENGRILVVLPFEQLKVLRKKNSLIHYHQNFFSRRSLVELFHQLNFKNYYSDLAFLSYRGAPAWNIIGSASKRGRTLSVNRYNYSYFTDALRYLIGKLY